MQYNEIYELVKPIYRWLEEHYPHDKYLKIEISGFSLCEDKTMGINDKMAENMGQILNNIMKSFDGEKKNDESN